MRGRRIKTPSEEDEGIYHCISRTVNGEFLFTDVDREHLRRLIWTMADYCGVQVLTYTILSNHFHVLVRVPRKEPLSDTELLRRYALAYPRPTRFRVERLEVIRSWLKANTPEGIKWREQQMRLMGDLSVYLKFVKQRFSSHFNRRNNRFGTLWSERFKSTQVEPGNPLRAIATYIDLNCIRASLAHDPKDYRFCGYAEALAGNESARAGIAWVCGHSWKKSAAGYRLWLFGTGAAPRPGKGQITDSDFQRVLRARGELSAAECLRCRIRHFSNSGILGSKSFIEDVARRCGLSTHRAPTPVYVSPELPDLYSFRATRVAVVT